MVSRPAALAAVNLKCGGGNGGGGASAGTGQDVRPTMCSVRRRPLVAP